MYLVTASDPAAVVVAAEVADSSLITGVAVVEDASKSTLLLDAPAFWSIYVNIMSGVGSE